MATILFNGIKPKQCVYEISVVGNAKVDKINFILTTTISDLHSLTELADFHCYIKVQSAGGEYIDKISATSSIVNNKLVVEFVLQKKTTQFKNIGVQLQFEYDDGRVISQTEVVGLKLSNTIPADEEIPDRFPSVLSNLEYRVEELEEGITYNTYTKEEIDGFLSLKANLLATNTFKAPQNFDDIIYSNYGEFRFNDHLNFTDNTEQHNTVMQLSYNDIIVWRTFTIKTTLNVDGLIYAGGNELRFGGDELNITDNTENHNSIFTINKDFITARRALNCDGLLWVGGREIRIPDYVNFTDNTEQHNTVLHVNKDYINAEKVMTLKQGGNCDITPTEAQHITRKDYVDEKAKMYRHVLTFTRTAITPNESFIIVVYSKNSQALNTRDLLRPYCYWQVQPLNNKHVIYMANKYIAGNYDVNLELYSIYLSPSIDEIDITYQEIGTSTTNYWRHLSYSDIVDYIEEV